MANDKQVLEQVLRTQQTRQDTMIEVFAECARDAGMKARHYKIECEGFDSLPTFATKVMADHFVAYMTDHFECAFTVVKNKKVDRWKKTRMIENEIAAQYKGEPT